MNINDELLHYVFVNILILWANNSAQLLHEQDPSIPDNNVEGIATQTPAHVMLKCFHKFRMVFMSCNKN